MAATGNSGAPTPERDRGEGWAGPLYWPAATDDLFDYLLRPASAGAGFWARGPHDLVTAMFARPSGQAPTDAACASAGDVQPLRDEIAQWPQRSEAERRAIDDLGSALAAADHAIRAACPAAGSGAHAIQRLDAMTDRLWAIRQAAILLRPPLEALAAARPDDTPHAGTLPEGAATTPPAAVCSAQASMPLPSAQIERRVRPTDAQRQSLHALQMTAQGMGPMLAATCPTEAAATPIKRLDAAEKRLNAMLYAARVLAPALHGFYASLSPEQRTAFDALGGGREIPTMARGER